MRSKVVDYSVLTLYCQRDIIIKSPHEDGNSETAGAAWIGSLWSEKITENFSKAIDKEKVL